ncbi:cation diffusion facilitator family transporter [Longispora urticae]
MGGQESAGERHRGRLVIALCIALGVLVLQVIGYLVTNSLALLADAGHVLTDAGGVALAMAAIWFGKRAAGPRHSFGYYRVEIFSAVINAVILTVIAVLVLIEAYKRISDPPEVAGLSTLAFASVGLAANVVGLLLLRGGQKESLAVRGAYLEVLGDLLGSVAVIAAAVVIIFTGWRYADPIASAVIGLMILPRTWSLLRDAVDVLLQGAPKGLAVESVRAELLAVDGVLDIHDLHVWELTSGMPVLSAHVVVSSMTDGGAVLDGVAARMGDAFDIRHSTFQLEPVGHLDHEAPAHP